MAWEGPDGVSVGAAAPARRRRRHPRRAPSPRARTRRSSTQALAVDAQRRATCSARPTPCAPSASGSRERIGVAHQGRRRPTGPEVAALRERSTCAGRRDRRARRAGRRGRRRARGPAAAHPQPARPGRPGRRRGRERHRADVGRAAAARRAATATASLGAQAALGGRRGARHDRPGRRRQGRRLGLPHLPRRRRGPPARAHRLLPRAPHARARHDRDLAAGASSTPTPRGAPARSRTRKTRCTSSRATSCTWCPTAEVPVTNIHRDEIIEADRLPIRYVAYSPVLPPRGGRRRRQDARHPARPPVRQGRDGRLRAAGRLDADARVDDRSARRSCLQRLGLAVSGQAHGDRRHGLHPGQEVRPRGLGAGCRGLARGQLGLELPRLPGASHEHPLATRAGRQAGDPAHAQRLGPRAARGRSRRILEVYQQADGSVRVPDVLRARLGR